MKARDASLFSLPVLPATVAGAFTIARHAAEKAGGGFLNAGFAMDPAELASKQTVSHLSR